jgi:hypothetical protein
MKPPLKVVVVDYLKYCSNIFLVWEPPFSEKFDDHMESRFGDTEGFYG